MVNKGLKKYFFCLLLITITSFALGAEENLKTVEKILKMAEEKKLKTAEEKIKKPNAKQVLLVGKIIVDANPDRDFIFNTFKMWEGHKEAPDLILLPRQMSPEDWSAAFSRPEVNNGALFFAHYAKPKKGVLDFYSVDFCFFSHYLAAITLPIFKQIVVPNDTQYLYIGTFKISVRGNDFIIEEIAHYDEYDEAKIEFAKHFPKEELKRAVLNPIE